MTVISISITESLEQIVSGIPKTISISANISAPIFYTLDGSDPTLFSTIYTGPIFLPTDVLTVTLKVLSTNGVDSSPIVSETYVTNILNNARLSHAATDSQGQPSIEDLYPFGTPPNQPIGNYLSPGDAGITVDNPDLPSTNTGFDGNGSETGFTNQPYNLENYSIVYSTTDSSGTSGIGIGNLPASTKIKDKEKSNQPEETKQFSSIFDPKALVIFQDFSKENPEDPAVINRQFFSLENPEKAKDGAYYYASGLDSPPISGSFVRAHYNPRDNTITHYYLDTLANKWIISKSPYKPTGSFDGNMTSIARSNKPGSQYIFQWIPHTRRVLF